MSEHEPPSYMPELGKQTQETLPPKERKYIFYCKAITIAGHPGSGESSAGRILADNLGIEFYDVGEKDFRQQQDTEIIGFQERPIQKDIAADQKQKNLIKDATTDNPILLVAKLSAINVDELQKEESSGNIPTVFVTCPRKERFIRILQREKERGVEGLTLKKVALMTREREELDRKQWIKTHPQLEYTDHLDPDAKDENGKRIYRYKVSSNNKTPEEVADEIIQKLIEDGHITKIANEDAPGLPNQGTIFEAV